MLKFAMMSVLLLAALATTGARCVNYVWQSPVDEQRFAGAVWNDTTLADGEYHFSPDLPVTERNVGFCYDDRFRESLVNRGGLACRAYVLDVETPLGTRTITNVEDLLDQFAPIDSEIEAASFVKATVGGFAQYDGATATVGDVFLVRMTNILDNCSETAGIYAVAYEVSSEGMVRVAAEEARRTANGAICFD